MIRGPQSRALLPEASADALAASIRLRRHIVDQIDAAGGWIGFDRFMELALYTPALGYYAGGARKFGADGDFVTAPEISPAFGQTIAQQLAQVFSLGSRQIIEVGAGSGRLAVDLLLELERLGALPDRYGILDLSGELRARQEAAIRSEASHLFSRVEWLDRLPERFAGVVLANEVIDAMPAHLVVWHDQGIAERGVVCERGELSWHDRPARGRLLDRARALTSECAIVPPYLSEIALAGPAWVAQWAEIIERGVLLVIDYGFPRREYYHPQRASGTLMCHYRHHAHADPFYLPGLQDITLHVDFSALAEAGCEAGLEFLGYTTQASFLFNCRLTRILQRTPVDDRVRYLRLASGIQKLVSPAEMGELFKVLALGREIADPLLGFTTGDRSATL